MLLARQTDIPASGRLPWVWNSRRGVFHGTRCAVCDIAIAEPGLGGHAPALRRPDGVTIEWTSFSAEELRHAFDTYVPGNCHVAEDFRRRFPELVIDRTTH